MPKMKTRRSVAKRFKTTGTGKLKRGNAYKSHILEKKSPKRKRAFRKDSYVAAADAKRVRKGLGKG